MRRKRRESKFELEVDRVLRGWFPFQSACQLGHCRTDRPFRCDVADDRHSHLVIRPGYILALGTSENQPVVTMLQLWYVDIEDLSNMVGKFLLFCENPILSA